jgi:hypothetical protein
VTLEFVGPTTDIESIQIQLLLAGLGHLNKGTAAISLCIRGYPSGIWRERITVVPADIRIMEDLCLWQEDED